MSFERQNESCRSNPICPVQVPAPPATGLFCFPTGLFAVLFVSGAFLLPTALRGVREKLRLREFGGAVSSQTELQFRFADSLEELDSQRV